jgi:anti-sigma regulatory factor (Ser/Thr protein kinase)
MSASGLYPAGTRRPDRVGAVSAPKFDHPAMLFRTTDEFLAGTTAFIDAARAAGDAVLVALRTEKLRLVREALDDPDDGVEFDDLAETGRNPGRLIPSVLLRFAAAHPERRVSIVGEQVWPGRSAVEYPACAAHEALINAVFADRDASILCPYDADALDAAAVADAWLTHPVLIAGGARVTSDRYDDPMRIVARFNQPLPPPPAGAASLAYRTGYDLAGVRAFVREHSAGLLPPGRADELLLAAHELTANTVKHSTGGGRITLWTEAGVLVCQVWDTGHVTDPLAGRVPPSALHPSGRGLLLVNQICDFVRLHTGPSGTTVRVHVARGD